MVKIISAKILSKLKIRIHVIIMFRKRTSKIRSFKPNADYFAAKLRQETITK